MIAIYHSVVVEDTKFFSVNLTTTDVAVVIPKGYDSSIVTIYDDPDDSEFSVGCKFRKTKIENCMQQRWAIYSLLQLMSYFFHTHVCFQTS